MLQIILFLLILSSVIYSLISGDTSKIGSAAVSGGSDAVNLCISLMGTMALWGGIMNVAEKSGITRKISHILRKPLKLLFRGIHDEKTLDAISMNVTANMLGLGNAATPLGIKAMKCFSRCDKKCDKNSAKNLTLFILLNTASVQLVPMTISSIRLAHGAENPWDCTAATVLTSVCALVTGIAVTCILCKERSKKHGSTCSSDNSGSSWDCNIQEGRRS